MLYFSLSKLLYYLMLFILIFVQLKLVDSLELLLPFDIGLNDLFNLK